MSGPKDTVYLYASARVRSLERKLLNRERMERMLEARSSEESAKILEDCGYDAASFENNEALESALSAEREGIFELLRSILPEQSILDVFRIRYDYHNLKVLIKIEALGAPERHDLLISSGRIPVKRLIEMIRQSDFRDMPPTMRHFAAEAREVLGRTLDPQISDFYLDDACLSEMLDTAKASQSAFLEGYVRLYIDTLNLRAVVRASRIGRGGDFLRSALIPGGNADIGRMKNVGASGQGVEEIFTMLSSPAAAGASVLKGEASLTEFERLCDNALMEYLKKAKYISFGDAPVIAYIAAKEAELMSVRTIVSGRLAGLPADVIRERLREPYV